MTRRDFRRMVVPGTVRRGMVSVSWQQREAAMEYGNAHTVRLASGWGKDLSKYAQLVFGELAKLAIPVLTHYHGDLYHDALWISNHITGTWPLTFYYGVRETGTNIGWFEETMTDGGNTGIYRCRVHMINHETCEMIMEEGKVSRHG